MNTLERWVVIFFLLVMVIAYNSLSGCAQLPVCEKFQYQIWQSPDGHIAYVLDEQNAVVLSQLIEGLHTGGCRLED